MSKPEAKEEGAEAEVPVVTGSKKKKFIIIGAIVAVVLAAGGGAAAYFLNSSTPHKKEAKKPAEKSAPAVFLNMENFVVNLQSENGDKYLQAGITMQVKNEEQMTYYKENMPQLRSRIILLLSSKTAEELLTNAGKLKLANEIIKQAQLPFNKDEPTSKEVEDRKISGVFFTSFMIQ